MPDRDPPDTAPQSAPPTDPQRPAAARARLTRAVEFPAGHRYWRPEWSEEENRARFGPCARAPGHGHTYRCEVTVEGPVDPETGMVIDLGRLDALLAERVTGRYDHAFLNDLPEFSDETRIPTTENLARAIWDRIAPALPDGRRLVRVRVAEDRDLWAEYRGG